MAKFQIDPWLYWYLAFLLLLVPLDWFLAAVIAAAVHEMGHVLAVRFCGGSIHGVKIGIGGTVLESGPLCPGKGILCALAGPAGSFLLLLLLPWMPKVAICALAQGLFNLIPVNPLDGGRAINLWVEALRSGRTISTILDWLGVVVAVTLGLIGVWKLGLGLLPMILPGKILLEKYLAKRANTEYNRATI